jgi:uncharacterized protein (DUF4213/DUF364 family)
MFCLTSQYTETKKHLKPPTFVICFYHFYIYYFQALQDAASVIKSKYNKTLVEASGGITEDTLVEYLLPEIDVVSLSRLTQGYDTVDFSLKIRKDGVDPTNQPVEELFNKI